MKTDDLVAMLSTHSTRVETAAVGRRFALAVGAGSLGALALLQGSLGLRPDLLEALADPMLWVKLGYPALLLAVAFAPACRLARPGGQPGRSARLALLPVAAIAVMAFVSLVVAAPAARGALIFGDTWADCIVNVATLAIPAFVATLWVMRGLAPTRPVLAGGFCGLVAGATGACAYALHCPEMAAPFIAAWYSAGIALTVAAGALVGLAVLRW